MKEVCRHQKPRSNPHSTHECSEPLPSSPQAFPLFKSTAPSAVHISPAPHQQLTPHTHLLNSCLLTIDRSLKQFQRIMLIQLVHGVLKQLVSPPSTYSLNDTGNCSFSWRKEQVATPLMQFHGEFKSRNIIFLFLSANFYVLLSNLILIIFMALLTGR